MRGGQVLPRERHSAAAVPGAELQPPAFVQGERLPVPRGVPRGGSGVVRRVRAGLLLHRRHQPRRRRGGAGELLPGGVERRLGLGALPDGIHVPRGPPRQGAVRHAGHVLPEGRRQGPLLPRGVLLRGEPGRRAHGQGRVRVGPGLLLQRRKRGAPRQRGSSWEVMPCWLLLHGRHGGQDHVHRRPGALLRPCRLHPRGRPVPRRLLLRRRQRGQAAVHSRAGLLLRGWLGLARGRAVPSRLLLRWRRCGPGRVRRRPGPLLRTRGVEPQGQHLPSGLLLPRWRRGPGAVRCAAGRVLPGGLSHV
mmetsp:Transcript_43333/g.90739  ORF Transcript_43333/g.90739 Transcript_43333/m.90739 type:complete len:305 (-) Transcript_43333:4533-5447(-)